MDSRHSSRSRRVVAVLPTLVVVAVGWGVAAPGADWRTLLPRHARADARSPVVVEAAAASAPRTVVRLVAAEAQAAQAKDTPKSRCESEDKDCRKALDLLRADSLDRIDLDIRVGGQPGNDYPCECRLEGGTYEPRRFAATMFTWKAAGYCHKPLYFEDWELERYGHSHGALVDPFVSAAHFFVTLPVLPYKVGVELPWECVYPLGYYRPGSCAPWTVPAVPISGRGFAMEAATLTGFLFVLP